MEPTTTRDDRPAEHDACLGEAFDWLVRLNGLHDRSEADALALQCWCARSALHAQAWHEAIALWRALLPAACIATRRGTRWPQLPRRMRAFGARSTSDRIAAAARGGAPTSSLLLSTHPRPGQSWS